MPVSFRRFGGMAHLSDRKCVPYIFNTIWNILVVLNILVDLCVFNMYVYIYTYVCVFKTFMNMERR